MNWLKLLLKRLLANPDALLDLVASWLPGLEAAAKTTETLLDDMAVSSAKATLADPEFREQFRAWVLGLVGQAKVLAAMSPDELQAWAETDAATQSIAGRLNIDWKALIAFFVQYILPFLI